MENLKTISMPTNSKGLRIAKTVYPEKHAPSHLSWWVSIKMKNQEIALSNGMNPVLAKSSTDFVIDYLKQDAQRNISMTQRLIMIRKVVNQFRGTFSSKR